ncbi:MAG: hypothetical protein DMG91_17740, partial [Acidobacteria bacterium]
MILTLVAAAKDKQTIEEKQDLPLQQITFKPRKTAKGNDFCFYPYIVQKLAVPWVSELAAL